MVHANDPERSYHIFYQLAAGASAEERARWRLPAAAADCRAAFRYLSRRSETTATTNKHKC